MAKFEHILSAGKIGNLALRNRIIMTPMGSNLAEDEGFCGEAIQRYYEARAKGGAAMVIMGSVGISWPLGSPNWRQVAISDDKYIPELTKLVNGVHKHDCKAAVQLHHGGLESINDSSAGRPILCPSEPDEGVDNMTSYLTEAEIATLSEPFMTETCKVHFKVADADDIAWVIDQFAEAAERAKRCGFDAVELHAGHGYLISNFLSPLINKRTDQYGGTIENRSRLLVDVIRAVKQRVGAEFPVWMRLDSHQFVEGGITNEDAMVTALLAQQAGADAIHCSADGDHSRGTCYTEGHSTHTPLGFLPFAEAIKEVVDVPIIMPGRVEPEAGDRIISQGKVDFITMGRKLLADPELPNKLKQGRQKEIRNCIYCYTCISQIFLRKHVICAINAETGYESERSITPTANPKSVLVVGGGPAGMEAARVAALRGHRVTLVEKTGQLGGSVRFSGVSYPANSQLVDYLCGQVDQLPIKLMLNQKATAEFVSLQAPDAVILASGGGWKMPDIEGIDLPHVFSGEDMRHLLSGQELESLQAKISPMTRLMLRLGAVSGVLNHIPLMRNLSKLWMPLGKRIVMLGGGLVAVELAEFLAERGRQVTILEESGTLGQELMLVRRWRNMADIEKLGVECLNHAQVVEINTEQVVYSNSNGQQRTISADSVIVTSGVTGDLSLAEEFASLDVQVLSAGDCNGPGYIEGAIHEGYNIASQL